MPVREADALRGRLLDVRAAAAARRAVRQDARRGGAERLEPAGALLNPTSFNGAGALQPYFRTEAFPGPIGAAPGTPPTASTPWVEYPKLYDAQCQQGNGFTWLDVTDVGKPDAPRYKPRGSLPPNWGLHLGDINLALGNLVDLARQQAAAYGK